jgi:hypothetical protein
VSCEEEAHALKDAQAELAKARTEYGEAEARLERAKEALNAPRDRDDDDDGAPSGSVREREEELEDAEDSLEEAKRNLQEKDEAAREAEEDLNACLARSRDGDGCLPRGCLHEASGCGVRGGAGLLLLAGAVLVLGGIWIEFQPPPHDSPPGPPPLTVGPIKSTFVKPVTTYKVDASSAAGKPLTYTWTKDKQRACGQFSGNGPTAAWVHPDKDFVNPNTGRPEPGDCPSENHHPGTISVAVSDGSTSCTAEFPFGSDADTGLIPKCPAGSPGSKAAHSWWQFDLWGLDPRWDPWFLIAAGSLLILVAGGLLFLGELGRDGCLPDAIYRAARSLGLISDDTTPVHNPPRL